MNNIQLDGASGFRPLDRVPSDADLFEIIAAAGGSFDEHLERAQTQPIQAADDHTDSSASETRPPADDRQREGDDAPNVDSQETAEVKTSQANESQSDHDDGDSPEAGGEVDASGSRETETGENAESETNEVEPEVAVDGGSRPIDPINEVVENNAEKTEPKIDSPNQQGDTNKDRPPLAAEQPGEEVTEKTPLFDRQSGGEQNARAQGEVPVDDSGGPSVKAAEEVIAKQLGERDAQPDVKPAEEPSADLSRGQENRAIDTSASDATPVEHVNRQPNAEGQPQLQAEVARPEAASSRQLQKNKDKTNAASAAEKTAHEQPIRFETVPLAEKQVVSREPVDAAARQPGAAEEAARPVSTPGSEAELNAPVRLGPNQPARSGAARPASSPAESDQVDQTRFVRRVAGAFRAMGNREGSVRVRLSPPELGSLRLNISVRDGAMAARVEAETSAARNLLLDNLPALRDRLAQQDIKIEQFDVDLMDRSPGGLPERTAGQTEDGRHGGNRTPSHDGDADGDPEVNSLADAPGGLSGRPGEGHQLNVVI